MIRAGILGATGYTGIELTRLLLQHPQVTVEAVCSRSGAGNRYEEIIGSFLGATELVCEDSTLADLAERCDVVFLALPHGIAAKEVSPELLEKTVVIDLGADFRLHDPESYRRWYGKTHENPHLIGRAVYGLSEIEAPHLRRAQLIANPGCYTTCSILSLLPLLSGGFVEAGSIIVDAKSGVSGAGRGARQHLLFAETNESVKAYGLGSHRHTPEIEQALSKAADQPVTVQFSPHLVPMNRGILATCYARPNRNCTTEELQDEYRRYYRDSPFVRILANGQLPETRWVRGSNYIDIAVMQDERTGLIIAVGAIDNLLKGAAGQAVQNMNIRFGLDERSGLLQQPLFP